MRPPEWLGSAPICADLAPLPRLNRTCQKTKTNSIFGLFTFNDQWGLKREISKRRTARTGSMNPWTRLPPSIHGRVIQRSPCRGASVGGGRTPKGAHRGLGSARGGRGGICGGCVSSAGWMAPSLRSTLWLLPGIAAASRRACPAIPGRTAAVPPAFGRRQRLRKAAPSFRESWWASPHLTRVRRASQSARSLSLALSLSLFLSLSLSLSLSGAAPCAFALGCCTCLER